MTKQQQPKIDDYLAVANAIKAINPKHQRTAVDWVKAQRRVDFHVDSAEWAGDQDNSAMAAKRRNHLRHEEIWHDKALELESYMPRRELENATKQMIAADAFIEKHEALHRVNMQMLQRNQAAELICVQPAHVINEGLAK